MRQLLVSTAIVLAFAASANAQLSLGTGGHAGVNTGLSGINTGVGVNTNNSIGIAPGDSVRVNANDAFDNSTTGMEVGKHRFVTKGGANVNAAGTSVNSGMSSNTTLPARDTRVDTGVGVDSNTSAGVATTGTGTSTTSTVRDPASGSVRTINRTTSGTMGSVTDTISSPLGSRSTTTRGHVNTGVNTGGSLLNGTSTTNTTTGATLGGTVDGSLNGHTP